MGTKFSFEFVIKADSWGDAFGIIDFGTGGRFLFFADSINNDNLAIYDTNYRDFGVAVLDDLKVHHLVVTVDGTAATLYDNGNQVGTTTLGASPDVDACSDAKIGSNFAGTNSFIDGTIYRARFYNRKLSADDVRAAFERADVDFSSQYGSQTELVTNGDFASATGWSKGDVTVVGDGTAVWAASGNYQYLRRSDWSITKGKKYRITVVTSAHTTNGTLNVMGYTGSPSIATTDLNGDAFTISGTGTHIFEFEALADSSGGVLFGSYPTGAAYVGTMTDISCVQIGVVTDYDLAFANPTQSLTVQDRAGAADGTASASGVTQVQPVVQGNLTSLAVTTSQQAAGVPADGEIVATGVKAETYRSARSDGDVYIQAATASDFVAIGTQDSSTLLKVDGSGEVTVNLEDAGTYLNVGSGNHRQLRFTSYDTVSENAGHKIDASSSNGEMKLATGGTPRLTIDSSGNVGVGCDPDAKLEVNRRCNLAWQCV